jgi:hypothetical protein
MNLNEFKKVVMERKKRDGDRYKMSYTTQEREFAVTFIHEKKAVGFSMLRISQELGVSQSTLIKWIKPGRFGVNQRLMRCTIHCCRGDQNLMKKMPLAITAGQLFATAAPFTN